MTNLILIAFGSLLGGTFIFALVSVIRDMVKHKWHEFSIDNDEVHK
jgi:uncharacterized integral membrane protein